MAFSQTMMRRLAQTAVRSSVQDAVAAPRIWASTRRSARMMSGSAAKTSTSSSATTSASFASSTSSSSKSRRFFVASSAVLAAAGVLASVSSFAAMEQAKEPEVKELEAQKAKSEAADTDSSTQVTKATNTLKLFCGNANKELAAEVANHLGCEMGKVTVSKFEDGEVNVMVHENVRGKDVYIIQPTCTPVNENLMELMLMISTMRRASARRITAVIPYYGYARQDRKMTARVPISAADVARLLEAMGVDRVVAVDLHCGQIQGFFGPRVPVDNLDGGTVGVKHFGKLGLENPVIVSPDAGGVYRAKKFREGLAKHYGIEAGLAMIIKQRHKPGEIERMDLVGSVQDADVIIVDDMIDTAGTLCKAANELSSHGAKRVYAFASHGIFSGPASSRIAASALEEVCITNTIPLSEEAAQNEKIRTLSVGKLIAGAIRRIHEKKSVSALFSDESGY